MWILIFNDRCFSCAKEDCALALRTAGSEVDVSPCYAARCSGSMRLKKNQKGYLLSCTLASCKAVWWVPKFVRSGEYCMHGASRIEYIQYADQFVPFLQLCHKQRDIARPVSTAAA